MELDRQTVTLLARRLNSRAGLSAGERPTRKHTEKRDLLKNQLSQLLSREEILWKQRSRVNWQHVDKKTTLFHAVASSRCRKNHISFLEHRGKIVQEASNIKRLFFSYFSNLIGETSHHNVQIDWENLYPDDHSGLSVLEEPFPEQEI